MNGYRHTQRAPLYLLMLSGAWGFLALVIFLPCPMAARVMPLVAACLFTGLAFCFKTLTVQDEGEHLGVRFGPLPVFRKRIPYAAMTSVTRSRSRLVDGWGIHCVVGRGWTWNLWGFDCAEIRLGDKIIRVGSDDADALVLFLQSRIHATKP